MIKAYGLRILPGFLNRTKARREAERLTGRNVVPVLVTDDGSVISESREIVAWAQANPARAAAPTGSPA